MSDTGMTDEELTDRQVADTMNGLLRGAWRGDEQQTADAEREPAPDKAKRPDPRDMNVLLRAARWGVDPATAAERMRTGDDAA